MRHKKISSIKSIDGRPAYDYWGEGVVLIVVVAAALEY
jgi:hypothetical protein